MGAIARARGAQIVRARAEKLPFQDSSPDFALLVDVVCFVSDPACVLREVRRILRPGGHVVLAVIDRETPLGAKYVEGKDLSPFYRHARFYSTQELTGLLLTAGFENLTYRQTIFLDPDDMSAPDPAREGCGAGGFLVIAAALPPGAGPP
jgi:SAM-dependent methyltransferase